MIINGAGGYRPSNYEALLADWQKSREQSLFDYAVMNNSRARAAQRAAASAVFGGTLEEQQRALFSTRTGAMIRYGSQFTENLLGSGSFLDVAGSVMNITQNAGFTGSVFGKTATPLYGPGMVSDVVAKKMFQSFDQFFTNQSSGTDNLLRTQGLSVSELGGLKQAMAAKGMFYGRNIVSVDEANLAQRALSGATELESTGNTVAAEQIRKTVSAAQGDETKLLEDLKNLKESASSGDLKGALETAFKTKSLVSVNQSEVNRTEKETVQMAKALVKLRNIYGDVAATDVFDAASAISGGGFKDPNSLLADIQRFESMARVQGYGDNILGVAQQQAGIASALSGVFGSTITGGGMATGVNFNILSRQRMTLGTQKHLTDQQVAENIVADVASTSKESNMVEATRLAYIANQSEDKSKIAAANNMLKSMTGELDIGKQLEAIRAARSIIGGDQTLMTNQNEQIQALQGTTLGTQINDLFNKTGNLSALRMYESSFTQAGLTKEDRASAAAILEGVGTDRFLELLNNKPLTADDMSYIMEAGGDQQLVPKFLGNDAARTAARFATKDVLAKNKSATIIGERATQEAETALAIDAANRAKFGDEQADPLKGENILRLGLRVLADGGKSISEKDIRDYIFAKNEGQNAFSVNYDTGAFSVTDTQAEQMSKQLGLDTETIKDFTRSRKGFSDFSDIVTRKGFRIGTNAKGEGIVISNEDSDKVSQELMINAPKEALKNLGLGALDTEDKAKRKEEAEKLLKLYITPDHNIFGIPTKDINDVAAEKARDVIESNGFSMAPEDQEHRRKFALQIRQLVDASGASEEFAELGEDLLTEDKYKSMRESFGLGDLTQETREALAEDTQLAKKFANFALNRAGWAEMSEQEKMFIEELKSGSNAGAGSSTQRVNVMHVTNAHFVGNITGLENINK